MFVKTIAAIAAIAALASAAPAPQDPVLTTAAAKPSGNFIAFGASMEDNGSTPHLSSNPAYWNGRYSNSYVWPEYAAKILGYTLSDNAYGGATSNNSFVYAQGANGPITAVSDAVQAYLSANAKAPAYQRQDDIVLIDVGGNDVYYSLSKFMSGSITPSAFAQNLTMHIYKSVSALLDGGFRNIYVANIQPLSIMPFATQNGMTALALAIENAIVDAHKTALAAIKQQYSSVADNVNVFDLDTAMKVYAEPQVSTALNAMNPAVQCITYDALGNPIYCNDPDNHLYYDSFHPCGRPHYLLGVVLAKKIKSNSYQLTSDNFIAAIKEYDIGNSNVTNNIIANGSK